MLLMNSQSQAMVCRAPTGECAGVLEISLARKTLVFLNETIRKHNSQTFTGGGNKQQNDGKA